MQRQIQSYANKVNRQLFLLVIFSSCVAAANNYDRKDFNYRSYKPNSSIGFYTNKTCDFINIDHIVSLKDAYESGASSWAASRKKAFANDRSNHVPSCGRVNSSKGSEGPSDFLRRSNDGRGLEYEIVRFCMLDNKARSNETRKFFICCPYLEERIG